jgi:hypothetical protein
MALTDPHNLAFEREYTAKFLGLGAPGGVPIHYDLDLAALDLGIHLTAGGEVTNSRVWFQLKGIQATKLPREAFDCAEHVNHSVQIEHLRAWYQGPEAVYLVLPLETRRRMEQILDSPDSRPAAGEPLRTLRALTVLEQAGTLDARRLLQELASGGPGAWLTQEAEAACQRLAAGHKDK